LVIPHISTEEVDEGEDENALPNPNPLCLIGHNRPLRKNVCHYSPLWEEGKITEALFSTE